jgi:hypothetical protein
VSGAAVGAHPSWSVRLRGCGLGLTPVGVGGLCCRAFPEGLPPSSLLWEQRAFHDFLPICFESARRAPAAALLPNLFSPACDDW